MTRLVSTLRVRLLLPILVAVVPTAAVLVHATHAERQLLVRREQEETTRLAQLVASQEQGALASVSGILLAAARLPSLRAQDGPACARELAPLLAAEPHLSNVGAATVEGRIFCSGLPLGGPVNLGDREHFQGALHGGGVAVSGYVESRTRGGGVLGLARPVLDGSGQIIGVAFAALDVRSLAEDLDLLPIPDDAEVAVVDRDGVVLATHPEGAFPAGRRYPPGPLEAAAAGPAMVELAGADGVRRMYAVDDVTLRDGMLAMRTVVSRPTLAAYAPVNRILARTLLALGTFALLAVAAAVLLSDLLVMRRLAALVAAARRITEGDLTARSGLRPEGDELGAFARAFDEMAGSLEGLRRQIRLLLDSIGDGILGLDPDGRITFVNPAAVRLLGRAMDALLGARLEALLGPGHGEGVAWRAVLREPAERHAGEDVIARPDGSTVPVELVSTPVRDAGAFVGAVVAFKDVSARRRLEEQLRQAQKMEAVGQLAGGVAHDFNNVLTAILSFARLVEDELPPDHPARADVAQIVLSAERATTLTRQLLAFSRRQRIAPRVHDLADTVRGMEPMLRRLLGAGVRLEVEVRAPGTVRADPGQLELVVLNLVVNARDAMPGGGRVTVVVDEPAPGQVDPPRARERAAPAGPLSMLEVRDTGTGMDPATLAHAFEPFFTTKPPGKGTGLGLSTVDAIVAQSGGALRVLTAPGEGTAFRIFLPRERAVVEAVPSPAGARPAAGGSETVLLVEDDEVIRQLARRALEQAGYRVVEADRAETAEGLARDGARIDLLLTDVMLPGESGWELSQRLRGARAGLKVLFVSGFAGDGRGRSLLPADVPFLPKPFTPDALLTKVREVLDA